MDATSGKFATNGDGQWVQFNSGTIITFNVAEGAQISVTTYNNADICSITVVDGVATITATGSGYIGTITISY